MGMVQDSTQKVMDGISAIREGDAGYIETATKLIGDLFTDNMQIARLANTWLLENTGINESGKANRERSEKFKQLRNYKQVEGEKVLPLDKGANEYANRDVKEFKRATSIREAAPLVKPMLKRIRENNKGNREGLVRDIGNLRRNQYATMPSPRESVQKFAAYIRYVKATQGEEAARALVRDYNKQNRINSVKREMIPQIR